MVDRSKLREAAYVASLNRLVEASAELAQAMVTAAALADGTECAPIVVLEAVEACRSSLVSAMSLAPAFTQIFARE